MIFLSIPGSDCSEKKEKEPAENAEVPAGAGQKAKTDNKAVM